MKTAAKTPKVEGKKETTAKKTVRNEEALKEEALDLCRRLEEHGLIPFDGVSIDFHRRRPVIVFDPRSETSHIVKIDDLLRFLTERGVRRVLIDALFPSRVPTIADLLQQHTIEVFVLRRTTALSGFKAMVQRRYEDIKIPRKNDYVDSVALAFTWPKFHRKIDLRLC